MEWIEKGFFEALGGLLVVAVLVVAFTIGWAICDKYRQHQADHEGEEDGS